MKDNHVLGRYTAPDSAAPVRPAIELLTTLQLVSGALQCVTKMLPEGERHIVNFTGDWQSFGRWSIADILDRANAALDSAPQSDEVKG